MSSGLYEDLVSRNWLVSHAEVEHLPGFTEQFYKLLLPEQIPFISYPYEWSFSQLQDAALLTLEAQKQALKHQLVLKDAPAYNVQFVRGQPILIDTLSFEPYQGQRTWQAYRQFCQHFLAPLILMSQVDLRLNSLLRDYIDGVPLDLAVKLLPWHKRWTGGALLHLTLHSAATSQAAKGKTSTQSTPEQSGKQAMLGLIDSLERAVKRLRLPTKLSTEWGDYYSNTNYAQVAFEHKRAILADFIKQSKTTTVWDLGGNDGTFSHTALAAGATSAICFDIDPLAVENNYQAVKTQGLTKLLPLRSDLTNPSPGLGWANTERMSLAERSSDLNTIMALALIHHLAIGNNLPFGLIAQYFASLGRYLIIEFVPKSDSKVKHILSSRVDIFTSYDQTNFEAAFEQFYKIIERKRIKGSERTMYLMKRHDKS